MPPLEFTPKHAQPFSLEEAMGLEVETLVTEIKRLENSIAHLQRTQSELKSYLNSEEGKEDGDGEVAKAFKENEDTISSQSERITLIKLALTNKLGSDARLEHYGLSIDKPPQQKTQTQENGNGMDVNRLPREIVESQGGGSAAPPSPGDTGGLHL